MSFTGVNRFHFLLWIPTFFTDIWLACGCKFPNKQATIFLFETKKDISFCNGIVFITE